MKLSVTTTLVCFLCLGLALLGPLALRESFFRMPTASGDFDCDDSTLLMMERLQSMGISSSPILGNLKQTGESYPKSDHVWLLADIAGLRIALDDGVVYLDKQHYEGFLTSKSQLLVFVDQDRAQASQ